MESQEKLVSELEKLNKKLEIIGHPWKFAFFNFTAGIFHSLGTLFGTLVVFGAIIYLISRVDLTGAISSWIEQTMSQIKWEKIVQPLNQPVQYQQP